MKLEAACHCYWKIIYRKHFMWKHEFCQKTFSLLSMNKIDVGAIESHDHKIYCTNVFGILSLNSETNLHSILFQIRGSKLIPMKMYKYCCYEQKRSIEFLWCSFSGK